MRELNPTAASLLGFLEDGEQTGYRLAQVAEELIGPYWSITRSQVYRELADLAERGYVEATASGARSRQPYRLTPAGHRAFLGWLAVPPGPEHIRFPLLLALSFGRWLAPHRITSMLAEHRRIHAGRLASYLAVGDLRDPSQVAVLSFGIHYERAVLDWIDSLPSPSGR